MCPFAGPFGLSHFSLCLCKASGSASLLIQGFVSSVIKWREMLSILLGFALTVFYLLVAIKMKPTCCTSGFSQ